jgi:hypothetical protein
VDVVTENGCFVDIVTQNDCFVSDEGIAVKLTTVLWHCALRTDRLSCHLRDDAKLEVLSLGFAEFSFVFYSYRRKQMYRRSGKLRSGFKILRLAQQEVSSRFMSSAM